MACVNEAVNSDLELQGETQNLQLTDDSSTVAFVSTSIPSWQGMPYFSAADSFSTKLLAFSGHNEEALNAFATSNEFVSLKSTVDSTKRSQLDSIQYLFSESGDGDLSLLGGVPLAMSYLLNHHGLLRLRDSVWFIHRQLQVSCDTFSVIDLLAAIQTGEEIDTLRFGLSLDFRSGRNFLSHLNRYNPTFPCGTDVYPQLASATQHQNADGDRRHSMKMELWRNPYGFYFEVNGEGSVRKIALQTLLVESISWKGPNNKYKTRHSFSWDFDVARETSPSSIVNYTGSYFNVWGSRVQWSIPLYDLPEVCQSCPRQNMVYHVVDLHTPSASDPLVYGVGTWGTHRGMGNNFEIVWQCN